ncbi:MAG TPA: Smr/MutS family protein [Anaeromyxobacteraceae bacterium]|nr:Smr/MutS family protein [Anaeromyxobacteraceae bacterium]
MSEQDESLVQLGWPDIAGALAQRCRLPAGQRRARGLGFLSSAGEVKEALARVEEARGLAESGLTLPLFVQGSVEGHLDRAAKGGTLEPNALRECAALLRAAARTRRVLAARAAENPRLFTITQALSEDERLSDKIERAVEPSGTVSDRASPELALFRERVRGLHRALKSKVEELLADEAMQMHLRDRYFTIRDERYVLPILASSRSQVPGIVHNASQSGQTLFVEPQPMVDMGNELTIASALASEEEARILRELSGAVASQGDELVRDLEILAELDLLEAEARLASELDLHVPEVGVPGQGFLLRALRHPLLVLQGKKVVASDVRLEEPGRALIVSGPNGGGKTVTITAIGLSACLLRAGLPIPAASGSRLPLYGEVRAAVDERGDLARDLSTFTAHLTRVRDIALAAHSRSLVLIDEIAADTDPREGAALAIAVLEDLLEKGAQVLVTTHLDELKALALVDPRFVNARVGFDPEKLAPTYELYLGSPGSSSALEVARRVGLTAKVLDRAHSALSGQGGALAQALRTLEEERALLGRDRASARKAEANAALAIRRAETREEAARRAEREAAARLGEAFAAEIDLAREEVSRLLAELMSAPTVKKATEAAQKLETWRAPIAQASRLAKAEAQAGPEAVPGGEVKRGSRVRILSLGQEAEVLEVEGDEALLRAGALKTRRPVSDLLPLRGKVTPGQGFARSRDERLSAALEARPASLTLPERRLDVRGARVEDLVREADRFLDRLYSQGVPDAVILHGHGTGALKAALREHLAASPYVGSFRPGERHEGGDAVTVVTLRR